MWFLNKKTIIVKLDKLTYKLWDEVKWSINFDFWEEIVKADKITIWLIRKSSSRWISTWAWISTNSSREYQTLLETNLLAKWEYNKEMIDFNFIIPNNAVPQAASFDKLLDKIPKWLRSFAEIAIDMFLPNMREKYSFEVIWRLDIPWAIDITERVSINIVND